MTIDVKNTVRQFVSNNFYIGDPVAFTDQTSFLEHGIVDSTGILEVVTFLEDTFSIKIADEDLIPENLDSVDGIAAFVARKKRPV